MKVRSFVKGSVQEAATGAHLKVGPQCQVELRGVRVLASAGHAEHTWPRVAELRQHLISEESFLRPLQQPALSRASVRACTELICARASQKKKMTTND
jgi:hypothetical protein